MSGDKEARTLDPLRARQVLSQLSYIHMGVLNLMFIIRPYNCIELNGGLKWSRTTDLTLIRRAL